LPPLLLLQAKVCRRYSAAPELQGPTYCCTGECGFVVVQVNGSSVARARVCCPYNFTMMDLDSRPYCCPPNNVAMRPRGLCCPKEQFYVNSTTNRHTCCPDGSVALAVRSMEGPGLISTLIPIGPCCPKAQFYVDAAGKQACCPDGSSALNGTCCKCVAGQSKAWSVGDVPA
jgi:hypothetical protein